MLVIFLAYPRRMATKRFGDIKTAHPSIPPSEEALDVAQLVIVQERIHHTTNSSLSV